MIPECVFKIRLKRDIHFSLRLSFSCDSNISGFVSDFNSIFWNAIYFWSVGLDTPPLLLHIMILYQSMWMLETSLNCRAKLVIKREKQA
jgi:hypothetical protein